MAVTTTMPTTRGTREGRGAGWGCAGAGAGGGGAGAAGPGGGVNPFMTIVYALGPPETGLGGGGPANPLEAGGATGSGGPDDGGEVGVLKRSR